jgi:hypothetical protein
MMTAPGQGVSGRRYPFLLLPPDRTPGRELHRRLEEALGTDEAWTLMDDGL